MNQNKGLQVFGIVVAFLVIAAVIIGVNIKSNTVSTPTPPNKASTKVMPADIEDGEYYVYIEEVFSSPEDTTVTFKHVMYYEGDAASSTAASEGRLSEVRNGVYVRESGAPGFTAPLSTSASMNAEMIRTKISTATYRPVFLVVIEEGVIVGIEEVTK